MALNQTPAASQLNCAAIVYRVLATHLIHKAGFTHATASTGAVTLIQRFGGALNLNVHFHMLLLDGVYVDSPAGPRFRWVKAPSSTGLRQLSPYHSPSREPLSRTPGSPGA